MDENTKQKMQQVIAIWEKYNEASRQGIDLQEERDILFELAEAQETAIRFLMEQLPSEERHVVHPEYQEGDSLWALLGNEWTIAYFVEEVQEFPRIFRVSKDGNEYNVDAADTSPCESDEDVPES